MTYSPGFRETTFEITFPVLRSRRLRLRLPVLPTLLSILVIPISSQLLRVFFDIGPGLGHIQAYQFVNERAIVSLPTDSEQ